MNTRRPDSDQVCCPTTKQLRMWLDGDFELEPAAVAHVQNCDRCTETMAVLSDDDHLQQMARASRFSVPGQFEHELELVNLRSRLSDWPIEEAVGNDAGGAGSLGSEDRRTTVRGKQATTDIEPEQAAFDVLSVEALQRQLSQGRWLVDRLLATGGSGAVYLAFDQRLQREVAIKVLRRDSHRDRQRFMREARLLAELEHPNIVRVFDVGTLKSQDDSSVDVNATLQSDSTAQGLNSGQLYLVLEYVSGGTMAQLQVNHPSWREIATEHHRGRMDYKRLANLVAAAADGLAAAHARGLVHRDVKPGNLLLSEDWSAVKVADFGLARLADMNATQVTRSGDLLGTPDFMSPEQVTAHDRIGPASDIYSLGATLYQLITGIAPFQGGAAAVLRQIAESTPVAPRLISPMVPVDLETICLHAMQLEPASRYADMAQFAEDLRAFAQGDSIRARPVSAATRAWRYLRRNPSLASWVLACAGLLGLLLILSLTAAIVFREQNQQLKIAAQKQLEAKQSAEAALKTSITAADQLLLAVTTETEFLPRSPGSQEVSRKLLERARDYFQSFLNANAGNPLLAYQLARAHAGLAQVAMRVGDKDTLERETQAALDLINTIPSGEITPVQRAALKADTLVVLANHLTESAQAKRAIPLLEEAVTACREQLPVVKPESTVSLADVSTAKEGLPVDSRDLRASYAYALFGLGNAMTWVGQRNEAVPKVNEARSLFEQLHQDYPNAPAYVRSLATCDMSLATISLDLNQAAEGKKHLARALEFLARVDVADAMALRISEFRVKALTNLALAERRLGNNAEAKAGYEQAMAESRRLIELEPSVPSHKWNLVVASMNSGGPDMELGNLEALVQRWMTTLPVLDQLLTVEPTNQRYRQVKAMLQSNIAIILRDMGKLNEAIAPLQSATETLREQAAQLNFASESYLPVAVNHLELATTYLELERWDEARGALDDSDRVVDEILEKDPDFTPARGHRLDAQHARLEMLFRQDSREFDVLNRLAEQSLELAISLAASQPDVAEYQVEVPRAYCDVGSVRLKAGQFAEAVEAANQARPLLMKIATDSSANAEAKATETSSVALSFSDVVKNASPEWKETMKNALMITMGALVSGDGQTLSPEQQTQLEVLQRQARELGVSEGDLPRPQPNSKSD